MSNNSSASQNTSNLTNTPSLNQINEAVQSSSSASQSTTNLNQPSSSHSNKGGLSSIFSRNSGSVKFSLTSTLHDGHKKTSKLNAIFNNISNKAINKTPTNNSSINKQTSDPSSASTVQTQASNQSDNIESILRKYANKNTTTPNNQPQASISTTPAQSCVEGKLIDLSVENSASSNKSSGNNFAPTFLPKNASSNSLQSNNQNENSMLYFDPNNLEQSKPFLDAKKKLRIVLGWSDGCTSSNYIPSPHLKYLFFICFS